MVVSAKTTRPLRLKHFHKFAVTQTCERSMQIALTAHEASDALLSAYEVMRHQRGRPRGMTTDSEQDLLRSMLVMAASGLDASAKQLIKDTFVELVKFDLKAQNSFEKFVQRRLSNDLSSGVNLSSKLLASVLVSDNPRDRLISEFVQNLIGGSLQSIDSLFEVAAALGADPSDIGLNPSQLKPVFETRNKIIHELDINLVEKTRTRNVRSQTVMIQFTELLFDVTSRLIRSVDTRLRTNP